MPYTVINIRDLDSQQRCHVQLCTALRATASHQLAAQYVLMGQLDVKVNSATAMFWSQQQRQQQQQQWQQSHLTVAVS